jgi:hypothetical protein
MSSPEEFSLSAGESVFLRWALILVVPVLWGWLKSFFQPAVVSVAAPVSKPATAVVRVAAPAPAQLIFPVPRAVTGCQCPRCKFDRSCQCHRCVVARSRPRPVKRAA